MKYSNLKHLIIYALVIIGYWSIVGFSPITFEYGAIAFFPFTLISRRLISIRWPINTDFWITRKAASNDMLLDGGKTVLIHHSIYSHTERITIIKILQLMIEGYMDGFLAATAERVQAIQTVASVLLLLFLIPFAIDIIDQLATPRDALPRIAVIVTIAAIEPVWWFLRYWVKNSSRSGDFTESVL